MANLIQSGAAWLAGQLQDHAGETITYTRSGYDAVSLTAARTDAFYKTMDASGFPVTVKCLDWIIQTSLIVIDGATVEPRPGDVIETEDGAKHEVLPLEKEPCFTPADAHKTMLKVHTDVVVFS